MSTTIAKTSCALLLLAGCGRDAERPQARASDDAGDGVTIAIDPGAEAPDPVHQAVAVLGGTEGNSSVRGVVRFTADGGEGVRVVADVEGLPPGEHAYHLHLYGDCTSADAESAGTHFNLEGSSLHPPADIQRITGDLGVLVADESGHAHADSRISGVTMQGAYTILGRGVIVHEKGNDPAKPPMGGAGGRLACGVVGVAETTA